MPFEYQASFSQISESSIATICNKTYLHIWETDSDIDNLLQLTQVIVKMRDATTVLPHNSSGMAKDVPSGMIILVEVKDGRDNFARVCELVKHLTKEDGTPHLNGGVLSFSGIKIVRGIHNSRCAADTNGRYASRECESEARKVVERINKSIDRVLKSGSGEWKQKKKIVWHHGPVVHFLNFWINNTTHDLRSSLTAITVHSALSITSSSISPSTAGRVNKLQDLQRLEGYAEKLGIFVVFLETASQLISYTHLATYMYFYAYYINTFLSPSLTRPHLHLAMDALITFCFRLRAACSRSYTQDAVKTVQSHLSPSKAKAWARECITSENYTKEKCQAVARDEEIHNAVQIADGPFAIFEPGLPAFSRLTLGPAAGLISEHYVCAPVDISFQSLRIRACSPSSLRLWLPKPNQNIGSVTQRIQGIMVGVLHLVQGAKEEEPVIGAEEKAMWEDVVKACNWALDGCKGKLPNGVEEKIGYVQRMLKQGTFAWAVGYVKKEQQGGWS